MIDFSRKLPDPDVATKMAALGAANRTGPGSEDSRSGGQKIGAYAIIGVPAVLAAIASPMPVVGFAVGAALGGGLLYAIDSIMG